ncbi:uncharacterized protein LOC141676626 [Apium graveolens]|uniref:uncharacterized protein LOC141676626 n=1 Tax=Apium graveolens TaxID=4045 RepID=UPI003D7BBEE5
MEKNNPDEIANKGGDQNINPTSAMTPAFSGEQIIPPVSSPPPTSIFDIHHDDIEKYHFMDMLIPQNYYFPPTSSVFDLLGSPPKDTMPPQPQQFSFAAAAVGDSSETALTPMTPNISSSISSSSNEVVNEDQISIKTGDQDDEAEQKPEQKNKRQITEPRLKKPKKPKQPRFAFMTKSDIDNLDDGYRWRKYGQKAVKNSPFPRNYYRCTSAGCGVKKRVERSSEDPTIVVTTYEGTHTHILPVNAPRGSTGIFPDSFTFRGLVSGIGGSGIGGIGGSLSSGIGTSFSSGIGGDMSVAAYNVGAMGSGGIGSGGSGSGANNLSNINVHYSTEQLAQYQNRMQQQYQQRPNYFMYNNPSLSSFNFGVANADAVAATTATAATIDSGSFSNRMLQDGQNLLPFNPNQQMTMFRDQGLLQDMVAPSQMKLEKKEDKN